MSIANGTTYYDYPLVQLTDRPCFTDYNDAFTDIDAKLHGLITGAETDHTAIGELQTGLGETNALLASVKLTADAAKAKSDTNEEDITILNTHLGSTDRTVATKLDSVAIAEPYDPTAGTYDVGDVVVYNGQRYVCTTAVAVSEPFDADKWTGQDVETVLEGLESNKADSSDVTPVSVTPIWSSATYESRSTFIHRVGKVVYYNLKATLNGSRTAGQPIIEFNVSDISGIPTDQEGNSINQQGRELVIRGSDVININTLLGKFNDNNRVYIATGSSLESGDVINVTGSFICN